MLWYKAWLDTRWRFLIGLGLLVLSSAGIVFAHPQVMKLMPLTPAVDVSGDLGRRIKEAADLSRDYRGYIWSQWFRQTPTQMGTLFAVLIGTGGLLSQSTGRGALFTLSLPASRNRLMGVQAAAGLAELLVLAVVPSLLIPLLSGAVGQTYAVGSALIHAGCLFITGAVFFSLALLLSTVFTDVWRPLLIACSVAFVLGLCEVVFRDLARYGIFHVMTGELYFRTGEPPWGGLLASAALSVAMLYGAAVNLAQRDF